jgi:hypothetical protein
VKPAGAILSYARGMSRLSFADMQSEIYLVFCLVATMKYLERENGGVAAAVK